MIAKVAESTGKHWKQVLRESLALIASSKKGKSNSSWSKFLDEVNKLTLAASQDDICVSTDHDKILWGEVIFVDTSACYGSVCADDSNHLAAKLSYSPALLTTKRVANEVVTLLRARGRSERACRIGQRIFAEYQVSLFWTQKQTILNYWDIFCAFKDKHWSFVDCSCKVVMEQLGINTAFAFDHHFRQFGNVELVP